MKIEITNFEFDFEVKQDLTGQILLLPWSTSVMHNNESKVAYYESTDLVQKLLKINGLSSDLAVGEHGDVVFLENRSIDWFAPTLFFSASLIIGNPNIVSVALNVLSNYIYDAFKHSSSDPQVSLSVVIEKSGKKKIDYAGPVSGLSEIVKIANNET